MKYLQSLLLSCLIVCSLGTLKNGDRLTGELVQSSDAEVIVATAYGAPMTISRELIASIEAPGESQAQQAESAQKAVEAALVQAPPPAPERYWESRIDFNSNLSRGNTDSQLIHLQAAWQWEKDQQRYKAKVSTIREEENGTASKEQDRISLAYNYLFSDRWFFALNSKIERDPIARIDHRYSLNPGLGYDIWNTDNKTLNVQFGAGYASEKTDTGDESSTQVDWRAEFKYRFENMNMEAFHDHHIYRNISGRKNTVLNSQTGLRYSLTEAIHLNVQLDYDYDTEPVEGTEKDDLTFVFGAGVTL